MYSWYRILDNVMRKVIRRVVKDIIAIKIPIIILAIYLPITQIIFKTVCPFKIVLGIDCPGCGLTRGCFNVLIGRWHRAIQYNPSAFLWVLLIIYVLYMRYIKGRDTFQWIIPTIVVCITTFACYVIRLV